MGEPDTQTAEPPEVVLQNGSAITRGLSAMLAASIGGGVGYLLGRMGDSASAKRTMAQYVFAGMGTTFGLLLSYFATKRQDTRAYDMRGAPQALHHEAHVPEPHPFPGPQKEVAGTTVAYDGAVQPDEARAIGR